MGTSEAITRGVRIRVRSEYIPERSDPAQGEWFFTYTVRIANESDETVQLVSRHWIITDANGHVEEVKGPGVVGETPILEPHGETFEYTDMYPGMAKTARDEGFSEIADWFETLAKAEKSHAGRFSKAADTLK